MNILATLAIAITLASRCHAIGSEYGNLYARDDGSSITSEVASKTESQQKTTSVDPNLPAGEAVLVSPKTTESVYVKSGDNATFSWTYTNVVNSPSAINVAAICTSNQQTYMIAQNQSIDKSSAVWDTRHAASSGMGPITAEYTLYVYDANSTPSATASAGELSSMQFIFGLYLPKKYNPWPQNDNYVNSAVYSKQGFMALFLCSAVTLMAVLAS